MKNIRTSGKTTVPVFFSVDDRYAPCLAAAIRSLTDNASADYNYHVHILIDSLSERNMKMLSSLSTGNTAIEFVNVSRKMDALAGKLHLRDYYTQATYYRFFIPDLFPMYGRGIYLDCDVVLNDDAAKLYNTDLNGRSLGAAREEVMERYDVFGRYSEKCLGIDRTRYFSAGVLLMDLDKMRENDLEGAFAKLLKKVRYRVTQDQDYLNVLLKDDVMLFGTEWNRTAFPDVPESAPASLVHYKINWKPWHSDGVRYGDLFWKYAEKTPYYDELLKIRASYSDDDRRRDETAFENLKALAQEEIEAYETEENA